MFPKSWAPTVYGIIQSAMTTALATAIATFHIAGFNLNSLADWLLSWGVAWVTMLPVVILVSPLIKMAVEALTIQNGV